MKDSIGDFFIDKILPLLLVGIVLGFFGWLTYFCILSFDEMKPTPQQKFERILQETPKGFKLIYYSVNEYGTYLPVYAAQDTSITAEQVFPKENK